MVTRPKLEMSLAQVAFEGAREAGSDEKSPQNFRMAEIYYLKARASYKKKYFSKAKEYADLSRRYSEKAELDSLLISNFK